MSFGFSPSDFIAVGTIVVELRRAYRSAPEEYRSLATNLDLFNGILEQIKRDEDDPTSALGQCTMPQRRKVGNILRGLEEILTHLERIRRRYQSGEGMSRVWNRLTFPTTDLDKGNFEGNCSGYGGVAGQSREAHSNWATLMEGLGNRNIIDILRERGISDAAIAIHREEVEELVQAANEVAESERYLSPDSSLRSSNGISTSSLEGTSIFGDETVELDLERFEVGPPTREHLTSRVCQGGVRLQEGAAANVSGIRQSRQLFTLFGAPNYKLRCRYCQFTGYQDEKLDNLFTPYNTPIFFAARKKALKSTSIEYHLEIHTQNREKTDGIFYRSIFFWKCHVPATIETRHHQGNYECPFCPFEIGAGVLYERLELLDHIVDKHIQNQPSGALRKTFSCWIEDSPALFEDSHRNLRGKTFDLLLPLPHSDREKTLARLAMDQEQHRS